MHFAMHAFSSHVEVLNEVTPIDLLVQSAVLFSLTGWSPGAVEKVSSACNRNRLRREYLQTTRRGGLACPPVTRCAYTIYTFIHPIYGNQNQMAQVIGFVRCRTFSTVPKVLHKVQCRYIPLLWRGIIGY